MDDYSAIIPQSYRFREKAKISCYRRDWFLQIIHTITSNSSASITQRTFFFFLFSFFLLEGKNSCYRYYSPHEEDHRYFSLKLPGSWYSVSPFQHELCLKFFAQEVFGKARGFSILSSRFGDCPRNLQFLTPSLGKICEI